MGRDNKNERIDLLLFKECLNKNGEIPLYPSGLSMNPFIKTKEKIIVQKTEPNKIKVGDIVAFHPGKNAHQIRVHRVIKIHKKRGNYFFLIKGDSCFLEDGFIPAERIIGKVISIIKKKKRLEFNTKWLKLVNYLVAIYSFITWYGYRYIAKGILIKIKLPLIKNLLFRIFWRLMIDIPKIFIETVLIFTRIFSNDIIETKRNNNE